MTLYEGYELQLSLSQKASGKKGKLVGLVWCRDEEPFSEEG